CCALFLVLERSLYSDTHGARKLCRGSSNFFEINTVTRSLSDGSGKSFDLGDRPSQLLSSNLQRLCLFSRPQPPIQHSDASHLEQGQRILGTNRGSSNRPKHSEIILCAMLRILPH